MTSVAERKRRTEAFKAAVVDLVDAHCTGWSAPLVAERLHELAAHWPNFGDADDATMLRGLAALIEEALR